MADQITLELHNRPQAWALMQSQLHPFLAAVLQSGGRWVLTVRKMKRTPAQNRRYWGQGVLAQVAAQATVNWRLYSADVWARAVQAHVHRRGRAAKWAGHRQVIHQADNRRVLRIL